MKYLYAIRRGAKDYFYGKTDKDETEVENLCLDSCNHEDPIEASDCFREKLIESKPKKISIEPRKCIVPKCPNTAQHMLNYGYDFEFALCKDHQNKTTARRVCGFGFQLQLREE